MTAVDLKSTTASGFIKSDFDIVKGQLNGLDTSTSLVEKLADKVDENTAITGATNTKITYDSKGLVTSGADATTADIADSSDKRYVTDAGLVVLSNTSGNNTGDETESTIKTKLGITILSGDNTGDQDVPTTLAELSDDSTHRLVTDTEKDTWNAKQDAGDYLTEVITDSPLSGAGTSASHLTVDLSSKEDTGIAQDIMDTHEGTYNHDLIATALQTETDPVFTSSQAANITSTDITNLGNLSGENTGDQDLSSYATKNLAIAYAIALG